MKRAVDISANKRHSGTTVNDQSHLRWYQIACSVPAKDTSVGDNYEASGIHIRGTMHSALCKHDIIPLPRCQYTVEHSNSGKKVSIRFDSILATESIFSIRQSDRFAACTLIFK